MKSRSWKKLIIILAALSLIVIAAALIIPKLLDLNRYRGLIVSQLEKSMGGTVNLGHISWSIGPFISLKVDDLSISDASVLPVDLKMSRIYADVSIIPLFSKSLVVKKLHLENPHLTLRLKPTPQKKNKTKALELAVSPTEDTKSAGSSLPIAIMIRELVVKNGIVNLEDSLTLSEQTVVRQFADVEIEVTNLRPGEEMAFQVRLRDKAKPGLGILKIQGTLAGLSESFTLENPKLKIQSNISSLDVDTIKPYLKKSPLTQKLGGTISLEVNYEGDLGPHSRIHGVIDLSKFAYTDSSMWEKALPGAETRVKYQLNVEPGRLTVENLELNLGNLTFSAQAFVESWRTQPVIKKITLSSNLPLIDLVPLIPWGKLDQDAGIIRDILKGGGKLTIENLSLPELDLQNPLKNAGDLISGMKGAMSFSDLALRPSPLFPRLEKITGRVTLENSVLSASKIGAKMGPLTLPAMSFRASNVMRHPKVSASANGRLRLEGTNDSEVKKLLMQYGLKNLSGMANIDMTIHYDQAKPHQWQAKGSLVLEGIRAETHPAGGVLDKLHGRLMLNRVNTMEIRVEDLAGKLNQSPFRLAGRISGSKTSNLLIDAKGQVQQMDLAQLSAFVPVLSDLKLGGILDMNVDVHLPYTDPMKGKIKGILTTRDLGFRLADQDIIVKDGNTDFKFAGNAVEIKGMSLRMNDQPLSVSGKAINPAEPNLYLVVKSPNLDINCLLPSFKVEKSPTESGQKKKGDAKKKMPSEEKSDKVELPPMARKLAAQLNVEVKQGNYQGQKFKNLKLIADYQRGMLRNYSLEVRIASGQIRAQGSANLKNLERIPFTLQPSVSTVPLESITALLSTKTPPVKGFLSINGHLSGRTGSSREMLDSVRGSLDAEVTRGRLTKLGPAGNLMANILALTSVQSILSGDPLSQLSGEGLPFEYMKASLSFKDSNINVKKFDFKSNSMNTYARGVVDLANQQLNMRAELELFGTLDKIMNFISSAGKNRQRRSKIYLSLQGPLNKPKIELIPVKRPATATEKTKESPAEIKKHPLESLTKGLKKVVKERIDTSDKKVKEHLESINKELEKLFDK